MIVLDNATGKLCKRWQGPATVVRIKSPYSYLVDLGDGRVRHVHANKMRKFHVRVQSCNIISENDADFGRVLMPAMDDSNVLPSVNVDRSSGIERLDPEQQGELLALLGEFAACVSNRPDLCEVCGVWLLFKFLVCEIVKLITVVWYRYCVIWRVCECIVSIAVSSRVCVSNV